MGLLSSIQGMFQKDPYTEEVERFESGIRSNPNDMGLRSQYAKFRLRHYFADPQGPRGAGVEAMVKGLDHREIIDPEFYYLMGRYYQATDEKKAAQLYLEGIKRFNHSVQDSPGLKHDYLETTLAMAMNLMVLTPDRVDPELEQYFKSIRKSYPLMVKRVELEEEIGKMDMDLGRVEQLNKEIEALKAERDALRSKDRRPEGQ